MTNKITYYAMTDAHTSLARPRTAFRRIETLEGRIDELFSRNLKWELSPLLHSAEHGDTMFDFTEITKDEADRIIDRIRAEASDSD
jgi:NRPS condensation-like uncharacterized protein